MLMLVIGIPVMADVPGLSYHKRGDKQWELSFGIANSRKISRSTFVPHMEFDVATLEFRKFTSPKASIGYELSTAFKGDHGCNTIISIFSNYERNFYIHKKISVDYKLGFGFMHLSNAVPGQGSKTNFSEQLGLGMEYNTSLNNAIRLEYTFYHASNAGLKKPNQGINATFFTVGYVWR